jgi:signal transduction histidine kinase
MSIPQQRERLLVCFAGVLLAVVWSTAALAEAIPQPKPDGASTSGYVAGSEWNVGYWIWDQTTTDGQECHFWRTVTIPADTTVRSAKLRIAADNFYTLYVDGQEIGSGSDWRMLIEYDLTELLTPGTHVLAIKGVNDFLTAGVLMGLQVELADGRSMEVLSDPGWRVVPADDLNWMVQTEPRPAWKNAKIVGGIGTSPWVERPGERTVFKAPISHPVIIPFWHQRWFLIAETVALGLAVVACIYLLMCLMMQSQSQYVIQRERSRIARDIHDDFGTRLTRLVLESEVAQNELPEQARERHQFARLSDGLREALKAMDEVLWAVNPHRDTVRDFVTYICEYAQEYLQPTGIQCLLEVESNMPSLDFDLPLRRSLLLAVKEAIANAAKHSGATQLTLKIQRQDAGLNVTVEDDGKGFNPAEASGKRNGIGNMIQRMNEVGGHCAVASKPGKGCRVKFNVPLTRQHSRLRWLTRPWRARLESENKSDHPHPPKTADQSNSKT